MIDIRNYTYHLPEERIALRPLPERDQSKLLVYQQGAITHASFRDLSQFIPSHAHLFFNDTKVIPARVIFQKETGASIELFLLDPTWPSPVVSSAMNALSPVRWHCIIGNLKRWNDDLVLHLAKDNITLSAKLVDRGNDIVEFSWSPGLPFSEVIQKMGAVPLPPYIKRSAEAADRERYQTVYSANEGAVAAPTAGLHFTERVLHDLRAKNITLDYLTLHVSAGTFQPVKVEDASKHTMHQEQLVVTREHVARLLGGKIIAVGTTSMRTIESIYWYGVKLLGNPQAKFAISQDDAYRLTPVEKSVALQAVLNKMTEENVAQLRGETSIYILPGYDFKIVDALVTNFHQPGSTLMLLVAAFVGQEWKRIYAEAMEKDYRFLSYGDSSVLFRSEVPKSDQV